MYLLKAFHRSWFHAVKQTTLYQRVCFLLTFSVNTVITIIEPIKEGIGTIVGIMLGKRLNTLCIQCIGSTLFAIRSYKFEVVSDTNQFNIFPLPFYLLGISNSNPKGVLRPQAGGEA